MDFNFIVFPSPKNTNFLIPKYEADLVFIPKPTTNSSKNCCTHIPDVTYIPCLFLPSLTDSLSKNICIYFHGNAEDIFMARDIADYIRSNISMNILLVEYPGYSIYEEEKSCDKILEDSLTVYDYINNTLKVSPQNIYIIGRSIGTSPAIYISSNRKPAGLCLISPFTSIRAVVQTIAGSFFQFKNEEYIKSVTCPILFIHGQKDNLIPYEHTIKLKDSCNCPYDLIMPEEMDHNQFDYENDFILPLKDFLRRHTSFNSNSSRNSVFSNSFYEVPANMKDILEIQKKNTGCWKNS